MHHFECHIPASRIHGWLGQGGTFASSAVAVTADRKQYYSHYYYKTRCVSGQELQNSLQENVIIMEREMRRFPWLTEYMWYLHQFQQLLLGIRCRTRKARRLSFKLTAQIFPLPSAFRPYGRNANRIQSGYLAVGGGGGGGREGDKGGRPWSFSSVSVQENQKTVIHKSVREN